MRRYLVIFDGIVKDIVEKEGMYIRGEGDYKGEVDTVTDDHNSSYVVGDIYTIEDYANKQGFEDPVVDELSIIKFQ